MGFIIMRKYELQLNDFLKISTHHNDLLIISAQIIQALKLVHETGYVYNDLRMENIMIEIENLKSEKQKVKLINYSLVTRFLDSDGNHSV